MSRKTRSPAWWVLFVLLLGMLGLLILESRDGASNPAHEITDIVIVLAFFGAMLAWIHFNLAAIAENELDQTETGEFHIEVYPPSDSAAQPELPPDDSDPRFFQERKN